ncbi:hypothetical protein C8R44DRAFT_986757 [Mycena epipterygia]|nr:hypothetical protein C8R44DRAFT_986757 [Mycena epipterygia]
MSTPSRTGSFDPHSSTTYRYAVAAALGVIVLISFALFVRSRILEHRQGPTLPIVRRLGNAITEKPRLYEAYLGSDVALLANCEWQEIMPLSVYRPSSWPQSSTKRISHDEEPFASVPSKLSIFISMPFPNPTTRGIILPQASGDAVPEGDPPLPYLEIGIADIDAPRTQQGAM